MRAAVSQQDLLAVIVGEDVVGFLQIVLLDGAGVADAEGVVVDRRSERTPDTYAFVSTSPCSIVCQNAT